MFEKNKINSAKARLYEEQLYEQVLVEIQNGEQRTGLWARAIAKSHGNEALAKGIYIELRVQALKDEITLTADFIKQESELKKQRNDWFIVCDKNEKTTIELIQRGRNKMLNHSELNFLCRKMGLKAKGKKGLFKDSWLIEDQKGNQKKYKSSDDLETFLVQQYELLDK